MLCSTALLAACGGGGSGSSAPAIIAPTITTQPVNASVNDGATATFTVVASGSAPLSYQWQSGSTSISGATAASYTTPALTIANSGASYTVVVSNSAGSVTSGAATVTVNAVVPTITTQPANQMATVGATATFTVVANGGSSTLSYQWKNGGTAITGATGASYTTPALTLAESGSSYTVVVTDSAGSVTSNAATVTVTAVPVAPTITTQPTNQTVNAGATATFTVVATGTATLTYQWKSGGTAVTGATAASYTTPVLAVANSGTSYTVVVSNSAGSVTSNAATVTVNAVAPSITTQPTNQTVNAGATATFTVVATGTAPLTYQWKSGGTAINGATAASYTTPVLAVANSGTSYTVVVSNSAGSVTSSAATVTVNAVAPSITTQPANQTVNDGATATFTVVATGTAPLTYQWSKGGTAISGATAASYTTPALTVSNSGASYTVMVSNSAGNMTSNPATVTVNAVTPTITTQPTNQTVEVGATAAFTVVANGGSSTLSYQWKKNGTAISGATSASYTTPVTAPTDNGSSFTVVVTDSAGHVTSLAATLTVTHTLALDAGEIGGTGNVDGTGAAAEFYNPSGLAMDSSGNIYVADSTDQTIRMITPGGVVTTVAGTAYIAGYTDATGTSAQFNDPQSIAVDSSGNLYVADEGNNVIRKITMPAGTVSTFAGTGVAGYNDGAGNVAQFNSPAGIAVDKLNAVYVADESNDVIRKITTSGVVSTIAGTAGTAGSTDGAALSTALFNSPTGVAVDKNLVVYVADWLNTDIRKVSAGVVSTIAGSVGSYGQTDGTGAAAQFNGPVALSVDSTATNLYVADFGNSSVRQVVIATGVVTTLAGSTSGFYGFANGTGTASLFLNTAATVVDLTNSNVYVADYENNLIRKITIPGAVVSNFAGNLGGRGYVDANGPSAEFSDPHGVANDAAGNIYVADTYNNVIRKIDTSGNVTTLAGNGEPGYIDATGTSAQFNTPINAAVDSTGNVYVADFGNLVIRKITPGGVVSTFAGSGSFGSTDGTGTAASFGNPTGVATDPSNNVYVADYDNDTIRQITPAGVVTTIAGTTGVAGSADGTGIAATFYGPRDVACDAAGNVYVTDRQNDTIRKITMPGATVTTLAGGVGNAGYLDGTGTGALFNRPSGLAVDSSNNVYVADYRNHVIRQITQPGLVVTTVAGVQTSVGVTPALGSSPFIVALPGSMNGPSNVSVLPGTPTTLAVAEAVENSILLVTLP